MSVLWARWMPHIQLSKLKYHADFLFQAIKKVLEEIRPITNLLFVFVCVCVHHLALVRIDELLKIRIFNSIWQVMICLA